MSPVDIWYAIRLTATGRPFYNSFLYFVKEDLFYYFLFFFSPIVSPEIARVTRTEGDDSYGNREFNIYIVVFFVYYEKINVENVHSESVQRLRDAVN